MEHVQLLFGLMNVTVGSFGEVIGSCGVFFDINPREVVLCRRIHPFWVADTFS